LVQCLPLFFGPDHIIIDSFNYRNIIGANLDIKTKEPLNYAGISKPQYDPDGFPLGGGGGLLEVLTGQAKYLDGRSMKELREESWRQYKTSPFIQPSVHDARDSVCGDNFEITSPIPDIQKIIDDFWYHPINELNKRFEQFILDKKVTGELFLLLTINEKGRFVEVDMIPPGKITGIGDNGCGIIFHSKKTRLPLIYNIRNDDGEDEHVPSTKVLFYPDLINDLNSEDAKSKGFDKAKLKGSKGNGPGGFKRYMVEWEGPRLVQRSTSYLTSVLIWNNFFTILKIAEIDHKRAMSAYCYVLKAENDDSWKTWQKMTWEEKLQTGLISEKPPGSTIQVPYGWDLKLLSSQLPTLTGNDNDLIELLSGGLNTARDSMTGSSKETYAGVKLSRGNISDRVKADQNRTKRFIRFDFLQPVFYIHMKLFGMPASFFVNECVGYDTTNAESVPVFDNVIKKVHIGKDIEKLITISMPIMTLEPVESQTKAWLGTKPAGADESLGISKKTIAGKLGISDYHSERLKYETEKRNYPKTLDENASGLHQ